MGKKVYIETTIASYLTSRLTNNLQAAAHQKITNDWWVKRKNDFELYTSVVTIEEASKGDPEAAQRRLEALSALPALRLSDRASLLAKSLLSEGALPRTALEDALHIAIATDCGMDYLLTWNCRHIDNAEIKPLLRQICERHGLHCPEICTPLELLGDD